SLRDLANDRADGVGRRARHARAAAAEPAFCRRRPERAAHGGDADWLHGPRRRDLPGRRGKAPEIQSRGVRRRGRHRQRRAHARRNRHRTTNERRHAPPEEFTVKTTVALLSALSVVGCASLPHNGEKIAIRGIDQYATEQSFTAPAVTNWPADAW